MVKRDRSNLATTMALSAAQWHALLESAHVDRHYLNAIVMEYLCVEGHGEAARAFSLATGEPGAWSTQRA